MVGDVNPDLVLSAPGLTVEFGQREVLADGAVFTLGGSASISACAMARLGLDTTMVGVVGDDAFGRYCCEELARAGVNVASVVIAHDVPTSITVVLQRGDDRAMVTHAAAIAALTPERLDMDALRSARHVHIGSYFLLDGLRPHLPGLLLGLRAAGCSVSLDTNWDPSGAFDLAEVLPHVDIFLPNAQEARRVGANDDLEEAVLHIGQTVPIVAVTDGTAGALVVEDGRIVRAAAPMVDPAAFIDPIGAGDAFDAGFVAGWLGDRDIAEGLRLGLATAALSVTGRGGTGAQPSRAEADALAQTIVCEERRG